MTVILPGDGAHAKKVDVAVAGLNPSSPNGDTPATVADAFIPLSQN